MQFGVCGPRSFFQGVVVEKKGSVARGDLDILDTLLALYVAAPVELALAALHPPLAPRRVSAIAAQQVAPVDSF